MRCNVYTLGFGILGVAFKALKWILGFFFINFLTLLMALRSCEWY
jgi:hypothetical protein